MKHIFFAALLLLPMAVNAQSGTNKVTNRYELSIAAIVQRLSTFDIQVTPDNPGTSLEAEGVDNETLLGALAEHFMQEDPVAAEILAGAIPGIVTIDDKSIFIKDEKGNTIRAYSVKELKGGGTQWVIVCEEGIIIRLYDLQNGGYTLSVPKMERLELRKI